MPPWLHQLVEHNRQKKAVSRRIQYPFVANDGIADGLDYLRQICPMLIIDGTKDHFIIQFCGGKEGGQQWYKREVCKEMMGHHKKQASWL